MAIFKKKKKDEDKLDILKDQDTIKALVKKYKAEEKQEKEEILEEEKFSIESKEYAEFVTGSKRKEAKTLFEKLCRLSGRILTVNVKEKEEKKLNEILYFIGSSVTAGDVKSCGVVVMGLMMLIAGASLILRRFPLLLVFLGLGLAAFVGIPSYPKYRKRLYTMDTLNSMPLAITYMVIYMRSSPTLEGAVRFAARHLPGSISRDMKKLLWDFETGTYIDMAAAVKNYEEKWEEQNRYFSQALELIRTSETAGSAERRLETLDEAAKVVLDGNLSMMKEFARGMKMPIVALYMLSIVLPVMGLILAPLLTSFMGGGFNVIWLIVIYNVILPIIIYATTKMIMSRRPGAFQEPDISGVEGMPKSGCFSLNIGGKYLQVPLIPIAIIVGFVVAFPGIVFIGGPRPESFGVGNLLKSMTIIWGLAIGIIIYTIGSSHQKLKMRKQLSSIEADISVFAYNIGSQASKGVPMEGSLKKVAEVQKEGPLKEFLVKTNENITRMGMTLKNSLFDPVNGSLKSYPSSLLRTIMEILLESARKGLRATANSLMSLSHYLSNLKTVEENIKELIGDTISTMKFQAQFLNSFITGIIVALNVLIFNVLSMLGSKMASIQATSSGMAGVGSILENSMFNVAATLPASHLQVIVGVYMVQTTVLMSMLINGAERGKDNINRNYMIGNILLLSTILYTVVTVIGVVLFGRLDIGSGVF